MIASISNFIINNRLQFYCFFSSTELTMLIIAKSSAGQEEKESLIKINLSKSQILTEKGFVT